LPVCEGDASDVNLSHGRLNGCDLSGAELYNAKFNNACLEGTSLVNADLTGADFRGASLGASDFSRAVLRDVRMAGANLLGADFGGADLTGARDITQQQMQQARTDGCTILPNGSRGPYLRFSGAEKPNVNRGRGRT